MEFKKCRQKLTDAECAKRFSDPSNPTHREYETLRAFFVGGLGSKEAAKKFGCTEGSFRMLVHEFRQNPDLQFFLLPQRTS